MELIIANSKHIKYSKEISLCIGESAKMRGTGNIEGVLSISVKRWKHSDAVIALENNKFAGFCYIEVWGHGKYVAHSGLIVSPEHRGKGLAKQVKQKVFDLSKKKFPNSKIFGITTGKAVMRINYELGYQPVAFSELTEDPEFWKGCQTCKNYDVLTRTEKNDVPLHRHVI